MNVDDKKLMYLEMAMVMKEVLEDSYIKGKRLIETATVEVKDHE